jgi:hypothetical protein
MKPLKILDLLKLFQCPIPVRYIQVSQKWRTNGALRCRRDYRKRQKNV